MNFLVGSDVITESLIRQRQDRGEGKVKGFLTLHAGTNARPTRAEGAEG